ncbi:uncharacterized protein LOC110870555 [Helianthus annuus]|uniref:uncharacterized protein LOC110870555 n=1 Tax=Helianthus annuus TaxID=4232 RepID=UPI000B909542|nr:uncharacterized protein LOC110870555 [Helianthus annuus]
MDDQGEDDEESMKILEAPMRAPASELELHELEVLEERLRHTSFSSGQDEWRWNGDTSGCFSVSAVRKWLGEERLQNQEDVFEWCKWIPNKCNIFMWRALMNHIPTKVALRRRNIHTDDTNLMDDMELHRVQGLSPIRKKIVRGVMIVCCWRLWKARNERVFENKDAKVVEVVAEVKALSFLWYNNRHDSKKMDWKSWCNMYMM